MKNILAMFLLFCCLLPGPAGASTQPSDDVPPPAPTQTPLERLQAEQQQQQELMQALKQGMRTETVAWDGYSAFIKQHYFLLDDQKFSLVKCNIRVPGTEETLATVRESLKKIPGKFTVTDTLGEFSLVLNRGKSLAFKKPRFEVESRDPAAVLNKDSFENGRQQIVGGLNEQIHAVIEVIGGVVEEYTLSTHKIVKTFSKTAGGAETTGEDKGMQFRAAYAGAKRTTGYSATDVTGGETAVFIKQDGKYALSTADTHLHQGIDNVDFHLRITYGRAGKIPFPKTIFKERIIEAKGNTDRAKINIVFEGCTAE